MPVYKTPGVYVEEISTLPPSVAEVATAVPAFVGYTEIGPAVIVRVDEDDIGLRGSEERLAKDGKQKAQQECGPGHVDEVGEENWTKSNGMV